MIDGFTLLQQQCNNRQTNNEIQIDQKYTRLTHIIIEIWRRPSARLSMWQLLESTAKRLTEHISILAHQPHSPAPRTGCAPTRDKAPMLARKKNPPLSVFILSRSPQPLRWLFVVCPYAYIIWQAARHMCKLGPLRSAPLAPSLHISRSQIIYARVQTKKPPKLFYIM